MRRSRPSRPGTRASTDGLPSGRRRADALGGGARDGGRRGVLATGAAAACAAVMPLPALAQQAEPQVVVVGGGFAGATVARALRRLDSNIPVTLVEVNRTFTACPFSNGVIAGL